MILNFFFALAIGSTYVVAFFCFEEDNELNINTMNIINSMSFFFFCCFLFLCSSFSCHCAFSALSSSLHVPSVSLLPILS